MVICAIGLVGCKIKENEMDKQLIEERLKTYFGALNKADVETIVSGYTEDGVFMPPDFAASVGRDKIRAAYKGIFSQIELKIALTIHEITVSGDYAFAYTESAGTVTIKSTHSTVPEKNKELFVLKKIGGVWYMRQYAFNKISE